MVRKNQEHGPSAIRLTAYKILDGLAALKTYVCPSPTPVSPMRLSPFRYASLFVIAFLPALAVSAESRWSIDDDDGISWKPTAKETHRDNVEMSGKKVSVIATYEVDGTGRLSVKRQIVWPMLRFEPNLTRHHLALAFGDDALPRIFVDRGQRPATETVTRVRQKGILSFEGNLGRELAFTRDLFPSIDKPVVVDRVTLTNKSAKDVVVEIDSNERITHTNAKRGVYGGYAAGAIVQGAGEYTLKPGESIGYSITFYGRKESEPAFAIDAAAEEKARADRIASFWSKLQLETPDRVLNTAFAFAKIRAAESIFETKAGLLHSPGGGNYYAAIWANDQAEYANPYFAMFGDPVAVESAINSYRLFAGFMNPDYKPIPSSIISEGATTWHGAGDRGDMAMIAYGASRFALAYGDRKTAEELWPLIEWCLEYCKRHVSADGVVTSDADELENRFPSGVANLCTSSLYYDALNSAAMLARDLGRPAAMADDFKSRAQAVRVAIERYFGRNVEGFDTYRYFDKSVPSVNAGAKARHAHYANEPDHLRAWICVPLTMGIYDRKDGTIAALFSPKLWTADGLATEAGQETFWDRSTLYALRGVFTAGETRKALDFLKYYSTRRLLGDHVPYPIEAWPENDQSHLSAESALYCRIYTEGMFGIRPTGLRSFTVTPRLAKEWSSMALKRINAFGTVFDLAVERDGERLKVSLSRDGQPAKTYSIDDGGTAEIDLTR
jgi:hypothetical protein